MPSAAITERMRRSAWHRWLGVGLAACVSAATVGLTVRGQLQLYINPAQAWFAAGMAILVLLGTVLSFLLPAGAEEDHGHDHAPGEHAHSDHAPSDHAPNDHAPVKAHLLRALGVASGAVASFIVVAGLVWAPAALSPQLAADRDTGVPPLFADADLVTLASSGDTSEFGIGEWSTTFASTTRPEQFAGTPVTVTGFVMPGSADGDLTLGRLVVTHCVIDAQPASLPVALGGQEVAEPGEGQWLEVTGHVDVDADGTLRVSAESVTEIDQPNDPYEY